MNNGFGRNTRFIEILLSALLIALVGGALGLAVHGPRLWQVLQGKTALLAVPAAPTPQIPTAEPVPQVPVAAEPAPVDLGELPALVAAGAVLVDARHGEDYRRGHLPGALSLPVGASEAELALFRQQYPTETTLITYCNGYDCPDSFNLALRLVAAGYHDVRVFEGGVPQWRDAGNPLEGEQP